MLIKYFASVMRLIVVLKVLTLVNCAAVAENYDKLVFAHVIFRHGERTPIKMFPNDQWNDEKYWPVGFGQLTNRGKMQQYELGRWLRNRYSSLVDDRYNYTQMRVMSSDKDRVIMSAQSNLAGFYPPVGVDVWNKDFMWQPIPIHTIPREQDNLLGSSRDCPAYDREYEKVLKSKIFKNITDKYADMFEFLEEKTGMPVKTLDDVSYIYDDLMIEKSFNFKLPEWAEKVYPQPIQYLSDLYFATNAFTEKLARFKSGPLLKEILERFKNKIAGKITENYWVYSAHDITIANMLNTMHIFKSMGYHQPPYASALMFELRQLGHDYYVQAFYKNSSGDAATLLNIQGCGTLCPLKRMNTLYQHLLPENWDRECHDGEESIIWNVMEEKRGSLLKYFGVAGLAVAAIILIVAVVFSSRKSYKRIDPK